ncbi:MAG: TIR domain-containing protein [Thiotrichaceae bacterium]|nr:TIR domain-containing protein [Thiotrichaceae bacterium]
MYNLLVSNYNDAWNGDPIVFEKSRCITEYTTKELIKKYGDLTPAQISELKSFPCIFAYEDFCRKNPQFGKIRNVTEESIVRKETSMKIEYEVIELNNFLTFSEMSEMLWLLRIKDWEMNRTHWALKEVDLSRALAGKGIHLPQWASVNKKPVSITKHVFDVALSFPGEVRDYVEQLAGQLEIMLGRDSYFYDANYTSQLARPSLNELLQDIYKNRSKLIVVFLCEKYQEKEWCGIEFRAIQEIIMDRQQHKRVMFIKMDDGLVPGVFKTDGYIDGKQYEPATVAGFIQERVLLLSDE